MDIDSGLHGKNTADALELLNADNRLAQELFERYLSAMKSDAERAPLAQELCMQLELHDRVEREVVYPAIKARDPGFADFTFKAQTQIEAVIGELRALPTSANNDPRDDLVLALMEAAQRHAAEEEARLFPFMRGRMGDALQPLGDRIVALKEKLVGSVEDLESRS